MNEYQGGDLWEFGMFGNPPEKDEISNDMMGIHHGDSSNLESPSNLEPSKSASPFSSQKYDCQYNQPTTLGSQFILEADATIESYVDGMHQRKELSTQEVQMNYQHNFDSGFWTNKTSCSVDEPESDLHGELDYYDIQPSSSGIMHDMPHQTDEHVDQLLNLTEEPIIDNSENVPTTSIQVRFSFQIHLHKQPDLVPTNKAIL